MKTPKEKAQELVFKFENEYLRGMVFTTDFNPERNLLHLNKGKVLAFIAINEIVENGFNPQLPYDYWEQVKQEIALL